MRTTLQFWNVPRPGEVKGSSALGYGGNREQNGGVGEFRGCGDVRGLETMLWFWKLLQGEWEEGLGLRRGERHPGHSLRVSRRDEASGTKAWASFSSVLLIVLGRVAFFNFGVKAEKRQRTPYHAHKKRVAPRTHRWKTQKKWPQHRQGPSASPAQRPKRQSSQSRREARPPDRRSGLSETRVRQPWAASAATSCGRRLTF